jgi:hypothetical protein
MTDWRAFQRERKGKSLSLRGFVERARDEGRARAQTCL